MGPDVDVAGSGDDAAADQVALVSPTTTEQAPPDDRPLLDGLALCLSGGGYRAMLFHLGALWRLNELGLLPRLMRVSSVSGGSIAAGVLGLNWGNLAFDDHGVATAFAEQVAAPLRRLAGRTIDLGSVAGGLLLPGGAGDWAVRAYQRNLFGDATLQDLPDQPKFVFNATNVQTGSLWRFAKQEMGDWQVGLVPAPSTALAFAVGASAAFPPVLSPVHLELPPGAVQPAAGARLHEEPYTTDVVLTDGGVYDNLGLETAWKRYNQILVSNGGGHIAPEPDPPGDLVRHTLRVFELVDNQVRSLRARQVVGSLQRGERQGAYWGIHTDLGDYEVAGKLDVSHLGVEALAVWPTRLARMEPSVQERLIDWGYAVCDAAMRCYHGPSQDAPPPDGFPYP